MLLRTRPQRMRELLLLLSFIVCLGATGASVQQLRGQRRTGSLPLERRTLYGTVTANVSSGPDFVTALRNAVVGRLLLVSLTVDVPLPTWNASGEELPIVLLRNVTIEGDPGLQFWPALKLHFIQGTVRLADDITLAFRQVVIDGGRRDNPTRAPGLDMLKPTLGGETAALVLANSAMTTMACFPPAWQQPNLAGLKRPPWVPGIQSARLGVPQDDCVNRTDVPYMRRCWVDKTTLIDMAVFGADSDSLTGGTFPNNLVVFALNLSGLCRARVDEGCLRSGKEPLVCYLAAVSSIPLEPAGASPPASSGGVSASATLPAERGAAGVAAAAAADTPSPGLRSGRLLAVALSVSLVGGAIVVLLVAAALVVAVRRRRSHAAASSCSKSLATASAHPAGAPPPPSSATLVAAMSCKDGPAFSTRLYQVESPSNGTVASSLFVGPAPAAGEAGIGGRSNPCSGYQDCLDEVALQQSDDAKEGHLALRTAAGSGATKARGGYRSPADGSDYPVTPYTPHRPSLTLGVALAGPAVDGAAECFGQGAMPGDARSGGIKVYTLDSTASFTLVSSSAAASCGAAAVGSGGVIAAAAVTAAAAATTVSGSDTGGGGSREGVSVVDLSPVVLGKGAYGRVHEGTYGGRRVAVKVLASLHPGAGGDSLVRSFAQEVQVLGRCQHPNIVRLLAAALEPPSLCLVMELMETSLEKLLHGDPSRPLMPMPKVLHIAIAVANALAYLHPTIVHRDLKPANVLVDNAASDRPTVKISDFGLSRLRVTVVPTENPEVGTPAYMAPECFDLYCNCITHQADMFSFGVMMWEMLSGERPWWKIQPVTVALMVSLHGSRLPVGHLPEERRPVKLVKLLAACWDADPTRRPAAAEAAKELALLLQEYTANPLPPSAAAAAAGVAAAGGGMAPAGAQPMWARPDDLSPDTS